MTVQRWRDRLNKRTPCQEEALGVETKMGGHETLKAVSGSRTKHDFSCSLELEVWDWGLQAHCRAHLHQSTFSWNWWGASGCFGGRFRSLVR